MNKKGFTLVEMLGVIVLLSVLVLITYTGITTMNKRSKENEWNDYKKTVYMASETYVNTKNIQVNGDIYINISDLLNENYLDNVVENPKSKKQEYNAKIKVTKDQAGVLIFEYIGE